MLLRSDGSAVACGWNDDGQCDIPPLEEGVCYTQVSAGGVVIQCFCEVMGVLLLAEGTMNGQCDIPPLEEGVCYTASFCRIQVIQCFCEVTGVLLLVAGTLLDNATLPFFQQVAMLHDLAKDYILQVECCL